MINNKSLNKNITEVNSKLEQKKKELEKDNKNSNPLQINSEDLQNIKEEEDDYSPIISRIIHDKKEHKKHNKKNKSHNKEESKIHQVAKIFKSIKEDKISFTTFSKKSLNDCRQETLASLNPFYSEFNDVYRNKSEEIIKILSEEYTEEKYKENNIIFKYGDEADRFFVIYEGNVTLFFPFTEVVNLNIDEYYIYILRLRRYNEIEMMNNVLLLNKGMYLIDFDESFNIDDYIRKLYNTTLKLKFDATFINKNKPNKKKITKIKIKSPENKSKSQSQSNNKMKLNVKSIKNSIKYRRSVYMHKSTDIEGGFDNNLFKTFNEREIKELVLRIEEELVETMKWIMPDKLYEIYEKEDEEKQSIKKLVQIPVEYINKYKKYNSNTVKDSEYAKRILPPKIDNKKLKREEMIIMKYLFIDTLSSGNYFGDFCLDSLSLFSPKYINFAKSCHVPLKMHKFFIFRNMTSISNTPNTSLLSFNKKLFTTYISKFIESRTLNKKKYLFNNPLFANTDCLNLIKTYSVCFKEQEISENEIIVKENEQLNESNTNLHFVIQGEFQAYCKKNIFQIDEVIKLIGHGDNIIDTFPKILTGLLDTKYYNDIAKTILNLKLNYLSKNDIIGLSEVLVNDKYFSTIICSNRGTKVYSVDMRIVKLLVDSDEKILKNKNVIVYHKYQILADTLLKQRKIFFDSFFNLEMHNIENNISDKDLNKNTNNNIDNKNNDKNNNNNRNETARDNFVQNIIDVNKVDSASLRLIQKINEVRSSNIEEKLSKLQPKNLLMKNIKMINNKAKIINNKNRILRNLGDLDCMLANLNGNFTLSDRRLERSINFRKKYLKKMEKLNHEKELLQKEKQKKLEIRIKLRRSESVVKSRVFQKTTFIYKNMFKELPLLPYKDNHIKSDGQYKLIIPYNSTLKKSNSANNINPLAFDDFNRFYNTAQYFKFNRKFKDNKFLDEKINEQKKDYLEYNIEFKSDAQFKQKKDNKLMRANLLTRKLKNIYKDKFEKILSKKN